MTNSSTTPTILITGATGTIGTELARQLTAAGVPFKAMIRTNTAASQFADNEFATTVIADLNAPETLRLALNGIEKVFLLTNSTALAETQQKNLVAAAIDAGVKHIVKLSQFAADLHSPVRFLRYHAAVEKKIVDSGISYTFLRPNLFMQGLLAFSDTIRHKGKFFAPAGTASVSFVDIRDIASVARQALTQTGHEGKVYDLTGPQALTHAEVAAALSEATGWPIQFIDVDPDEMRQALLSFGFPEWQAEGLLEDYAHYRRGEASYVSNAIQLVTGCAPIDFGTFAKDHAGAFVIHQ